MVTKTVYREVAVDVDIDLDDYDTDELIAEIEDRDGGNKWLVVDKLDTDFVAPDVEDKIRDLKEDFLNWYQFGMKNENFEKALKEFFKDTIDEFII
jgi:hypothetical protein